MASTVLDGASEEVEGERVSVFEVGEVDEDVADGSLSEVVGVVSVAPAVELSSVGS